MKTRNDINEPNPAQNRLFGYYYGPEAEQFSFFRVPKILFTNPLFEALSNEAKLLYGLMLERMGLSLKNGWLDESGRVFIYYSIESIKSDLGCGKDKCIKLLRELDVEHGIGLIERKRQGLGKPDIIYVKNFVTGNSTSINVFENIDLQKSENQNSASRESRITELGESATNKTELSNPEMNQSHPICEEEDEMDVSVVEEAVKQQIGYETLQEEVRNNGSIDELVCLIVEILCAKSASLRIASKELPGELVKSRFRKLRYEHIRAVYDRLQVNTVKVSNIKQYMLTMLFNAPATRNNQLRADTNYELYGGGYVEDEDEA